MNGTVSAVVAVATAIVGLAIVAVLVSKNSATGDVLTSFGNAFSSAIKEAVSPITVGNTSATS